jgi:hypothetical protein
MAAAHVQSPPRLAAVQRAFEPSRHRRLPKLTGEQRCPAVVSDEHHCCMFFFFDAAPGLLSFVQELRRAPLLSSQLTTPPSQAPARLRRVPSHFTAEPEPPESPLPSSSCASVPESGAAASTAAEFHAPRLRPEHQSSPRAAAPPRAEPPPVLPGAATEHVHLVVMPEHAK